MDYEKATDHNKKELEVNPLRDNVTHLLLDC